MTWRTVAAALWRRPDLWAVAAVQGLRLAPRAWWRAWPPSPSPPADYLAFRLQTQYGDREGPPTAADLVSYLEWRRAWRRVARRD